MVNKNIVFFDFDRTLTKKDSFLEFLIYFFGYKKFIIGIIKNLHIIVLYKLKFVSNSYAKEKITKYFFEDISFDDFQEKANYFSSNMIDNLINKDIKKKLMWHIDRGDKVVVVSASFECYLKKWCDKNKIQLLATKLEFKEGNLTGKFATQNCHGIEKVNRIKERYNLDNYDEIYVYGDSEGDYEMLKLAKKDKRFYRCF